MGYFSPAPTTWTVYKNIYCDITVKHLFAFLIVVSVFIPLKLNIQNFLCWVEFDLNWSIIIYYDQLALNLTEIEVFQNGIP